MSTIGIDMHNTVSATEIIDIVGASVKTLIENPELAHVIPPTLLRGAPGVGKSAIVRELARRLKIGFIDVRLAQMERVDVSGLPTIKDDTTQWLPPAFWPRDPESKGIIFFDEITSAPVDCQVAAYSLVLERVVPNSNYKLPNGWYIIAAGNRDTDRAVARPISSALANRFSHYELEANAEDWNSWAVAHDIHPSVTGFVRYRPTLLFKMEGQDLQQGWPSPRSWERVANIIPMFSDNEEILQKVVYGLIGHNVGVEFMAFYKVNKKFDDVLEMLTNPKATIVIPERSDEKYAMTSAVAYLLWNGTNDKEDALRVEGMFRIAMEMTDDFATMMVKNATVGNKRVTRVDAIKKIILSKNYEKFNAKFGTSMTKRFSLKLEA